MDTLYAVEVQGHKESNSYILGQAENVPVSRERVQQAEPSQAESTKKRRKTFNEKERTEDFLDHIKEYVAK